MIRYKLIAVHLCMLLFLSCQDSENPKKLIGNWTGIEWLVDGKASTMNARETHFNFEENGGYSFEYAGTKEMGTYKVENDMLFTTPKGEQEIMVKIVKLTADSLTFEMNRGGRPETLSLIRR